MARSVSYLSETKFDSDGNGVPETSAPGTRTQEFDDQRNLVHDRSTIDLNGDGTPDFVDDSRFTYDANTKVATEAVTHGTENPGLAKLIAATDSVYTNAYNGQSTLNVDINADGVVDKRFTTAQNTYDQNTRQATIVVDVDNDGDGKIDYRESVTNNYDAQGKLVGEHQQIDRDANGVADFLYTATHMYDAQGELISSKFTYDFNGDGTNDIETSQNVAQNVAVAPPTTQTTDPTTQTTNQTPQTTNQTPQTTNQTPQTTNQTPHDETTKATLLKQLAGLGLLERSDNGDPGFIDQEDVVFYDKGNKALVKQAAEYQKLHHDLPDGNLYIELDKLLNGDKSVRIPVPSDNQPAPADPSHLTSDNQPAPADPSHLTSDNQPAPADSSHLTSDNQPAPADPSHLTSAEGDFFLV